MAFESRSSRTMMWINGVGGAILAVLTAISLKYAAGVQGLVQALIGSAYCLECFMSGATLRGGGVKARGALMLQSSCIRALTLMAVSCFSVGSGNSRAAAPARSASWERLVMHPKYNGEGMLVVEMPLPSRW